MKNTVLALATVTLLAACSGSGDAGSTDTAAATGAMPSTDTAMAAPAASTVTDPQIAAIVVAANTADIEGGRLAASKSRNAQVKEFAQRMITDHEGVNKAAVALVTRLNVTPEESDVSRQQTESGKQSRDSLQKMSGADFDRAYINNEVTYHQNLLGAIDKVLLPSAQNADLRKLLEDTRPAVVSHLEHATRLQGTLAAK